MAWYRKLHWQIIIGLLLGLVYGILAAAAGWGRFTADWIAPFGTVFINLLKLIAVPLVLTSLISGVASLSDLQEALPHRRQDHRRSTSHDHHRGEHRPGPGQRARARPPGAAGDARVARGDLPEDAERPHRPGARGRRTRPAATAGRHGAGQLLRRGGEQPQHAPGGVRRRAARGGSDPGQALARQAGAGRRARPQRGDHPVWST